MSTQETLQFLPPITALDLMMISDPIVYVGAVGFEERALAVLDEAVRAGKKIGSVVGIQYEPVDIRNRINEFADHVAKLGIPERQIVRLVYDRYNPQDFVASIGEIQKLTTNASSIIIDISAMSKFLIVVLLQSLVNTKLSSHIVYSEANIYHPTSETFTRQKQGHQETMPEYLTTDIYKIVTTTSLSSSSMQGYPLMMIAFPTFNYKELFALVNELSPKNLILLEGIPHAKQDAWRVDAIRWLNARMQEDVLKSYQVSTFDYKETLIALEEIYKKFMHSHKILVSPTGSKLQTFAVFLFRQMHPDVQLVYPVTKKFATEYTEGYRAIWQITLSSFFDLQRELDKHRKHSLSELKGVIESHLRKI